MWWKAFFFQFVGQSIFHLFSVFFWEKKWKWNKIEKGGLSGHFFFIKQQIEFNVTELNFPTAISI